MSGAFDKETELLKREQREAVLEDCKAFDAATVEEKASKDFVMSFLAKARYHSAEAILRKLQSEDKDSAAAPLLKLDRDIIMAACSTYGDCLGYASDDLKADYELVLAAVKNRGYALKFAAATLRDDVTICEAAVTNDGYALN
jgi:hypothetical protein